MQNLVQQRLANTPSSLLVRNQIIQSPVNIGTSTAIISPTPQLAHTMTVNSSISSIPESRSWNNLQKQEQIRQVSTLALASLRSRMHKIAFDNGISHVSPEAVFFMMNTIEVKIICNLFCSHLKHFLLQILKHTKCGNRQQPSPPSIHPPNLLLKHEDGTTIVNTAKPRQRQLSISMEDLFENILANPSIFGPDYAVTLERIGLSLLD
jgi:hypothetical protein